MRLLDYTVPLGGADTDVELHSLLKEINQVDWDTFPPSTHPGPSRGGARPFLPDEVTARRATSSGSTLGHPHCAPPPKHASAANSATKFQPLTWLLNEP